MLLSDFIYNEINCYTLCISIFLPIFVAVNKRLSSIAGKFFCKFNGIAIPLYLFFRSTNLNKIYDSVAYPRQDFFITTLLFLKGKNKFEEQTTDFLYNSS